MEVRFLQTVYTKIIWRIRDGCLEYLEIRTKELRGSRERARCGVALGRVGATLLL